MLSCPFTMVLPGCSSRLCRGLPGTSHVSGSAAAHGRERPGVRARAWNRAHSSQRQRSPGCVLTLRRPGFDTQLSSFRTVPNPRSRQAPPPTWRLILTRELAKFSLMTVRFSRSRLRFLGHSPRLPDLGERTFHGHTRILPIGQGDCNRD